MQKEEITAIFNKQASSYEQQWSKMASINDALYLLTSTVLSELPLKANILCVGAGTGAEILYLAQKFPEWHFTAVEPSTAMLDVFRRRAEEHGIRHDVSSIRAISTLSRRMDRSMPPLFFWSRNSSWSAMTDQNSSKALPNVFAQRVS